MVFLWTDILIWLLVLLVVLFARYTSNRRHLREPWERVFRSRVAVGAALVLSLFIAIGLLDSIHFRASNDTGNGEEVLSLFDAMVPSLRERQEKTYSAPFATHLYAKETVRIPRNEAMPASIEGLTTAMSDEGRQRIHPRLVYGGAHLEDPDERSRDILIRSAMGGLKALAVWFIFMIVCARIFRREQRAGEVVWDWLSGGAQTCKSPANPFPWSTFWWVTLILLLLGFVAVELSQGYHILGTDKVGQSVFYQALKSIRTGLVIGTLTTLVMLPAAILLGVMAGYFRGWIDDVIQYLYTTLNSIPGVLLIAAAILMLQVYMDNHADEFASVIERADLRLLWLCIILGVTSWTGLCRLLRGEAMKIRELDYVQASQAFGVSHFRILMRHLVPNVMHIVLITVVLDFSGLVLAEAVLSYINIGVDPTTESWGNMINSARLEMAREPIVWWSLAAALVFMFSLVLAANLFSDVVRDAFDPRLRGERNG